jgi:hypothetical protein
VSTVWKSIHGVRKNRGRNETRSRKNKGISAKMMQMNSSQGDGGEKGQSSI